MDEAVLLRFYCRVRPLGLGWEQMALNTAIFGSKFGSHSSSRNPNSVTTDDGGPSGDLVTPILAGTDDTPQQRDVIDDDKVWERAVKQQSQENHRDLACCFLLAAPWQLMLFLCTVSFVISNWAQSAVLFGCVTIWTALLYNFWFTRLKKSEGNADESLFALRTAQLDQRIAAAASTTNLVGDYAALAES